MFGRATIRLGIGTHSSPIYNFVSCNIFDCWELLHSSSRKPLDKVVTLFSFPEIFFVNSFGQLEWVSMC